VADGGVKMKYPMKLGELIATLKRKDQDAWIKFDFVHFTPEGIHSYRGDYSELAIGYTDNNQEVKVKDVVAMLEGANGKTFIGYKGGEYDMHDNTLVWVAKHNEAGNTAVTDVVDAGWCIVLETGWVNK
jgi:hypothetical protein